MRRVASRLGAADPEPAAANEPVEKAPEFPHRARPRNVIRIEFEMMLKGAVYDRAGGKIKQYGVTVDGATKVVTSGDFVDQATYKALLTSGAVRPPAQAAGAGRRPAAQTAARGLMGCCRCIRVKVLRMPCR